MDIGRDGRRALRRDGDEPPAGRGDRREEPAHQDARDTRRTSDKGAGRDIQPGIVRPAGAGGIYAEPFMFQTLAGGHSRPDFLFRHETLHLGIAPLPGPCARPCPGRRVGRNPGDD